MTDKASNSTCTPRIWPPDFQTVRQTCSQETPESMIHTCWLRIGTYSTPGYRVPQYLLRAWSTRNRHRTSSEASWIETVSGSCELRNGCNGDCSGGTKPSKEKNVLSVQVHIFHTTYNEILSTFYEILHLVDGIVTWRQVVHDRDGWKGATREALTLLG